MPRRADLASNVNHRFLSLLLLTGFSATIGFFAFRTWQPPLEPQHMVVARTNPLAASSDVPPAKHAYLRHTFRLTEPPIQAWLKLVGHDKIELFVNGRRAGRSARGSQDRYVGIVKDVTHLLKPGLNSIAIHLAQSVIDRPPAVSVEGACRMPSGNELAIDHRSDWRLSNVFERDGTFWYATDFDDSEWKRATVGDSVDWRAPIASPPGAVTLPRQSQWISANKPSGGTASFAKEFQIEERPRSAWLRLLTNGSFRLAVNGSIVADDSLNVGEHHRKGSIERTFAIGSLLRPGANTIAVAVTSSAAIPRLRADLESTSASGARSYFATNETWNCRTGQTPDWQSLGRANDADWQPAQADIGYLKVLPWNTKREATPLELPARFYLQRTATWVALSLGLGILTLGGCLLVARLAHRLLSKGQPPVGAVPNATLLPYLALLPSTLIALGLGLAVYDVGFVALDFYRPIWLLGLLLLVVMQWLALLLFSTFRRAAPQPADSSAPSNAGRWQRAALVAYVGLLVLTGGWLRLQNITAEPIHHDEVGAYAFTMAIVQTGLPGGKIADDFPYGYCATSELAYYPNVPFALLLDDPLLVVRLPAVCWSLATIVLIFLVGRRLFDLPVALVAATLYTIAPQVLVIANFGRYLSQLQFLVLLTTFLFYKAVSSTGRVRHGVFFAGVLSFVAMYLTWEGVGLFGFGLALAILVHRRRHLRPLLTDPRVYVFTSIVIVVAILQNAHRIDQQTQRLWYGEGISSLSLKMMWRYPLFDPLFYVLQTSWMSAALLPMMGLVGGLAMAVRHPHRLALRFLLLSLLTNALLMSALLPLHANRYSYHLLPFLLLISSVVLVAVAQYLVRCIDAAPLSRWFQWYARGLTGLSVLFVMALASGHLIRPTQMQAFVARAYETKQIHFPHWDGPVNYLRAHVQPGDVVIANFPHAANFVMQSDQNDPAHADWHVDYWLQSTLYVQATLGDDRTQPLDRRSGAEMIYNVRQLDQIFSSTPRVWYCTTRYGQSRNNDQIVSQYLRQHMDVVYEDFSTSVMMKDQNHRPAWVREEEEAEGQMASDFYLR